MRLIVEGLGHRFPGGHWLFRGLDHDFRPGTVTALTGPSGCGKSTLLAIVAGSTTPEEGTVVRHGLQSTGWVFQNPHGTVGRTALDHVVLPLLTRGLTRRRAEVRARDLLGLFGLADAHARRYAQLSGGEAQRLMLARALAGDPDLLLVDEPTAQLDPQNASTVSRTLGHLADAGAVVVVATHDRTTRDACDEVVDLAVP